MSCNLAQRPTACTSAPIPSPLPDTLQPLRLAARGGGTTRRCLGLHRAGAITEGGCVVCLCRSTR
jgi:hypothetical protein